MTSRAVEGCFEQPPFPDPWADTAVLDARIVTVDHYRRKAVAALQERQELNARMLAIFRDGAGTVIEFCALSEAHEGATHRLGEALVTLDQLSSSAGIA